ncbi:Calreticulin [Olea europaea subsp. europaea]|uniref:Calreticulin n=1 Tax=Olea europaea subsp. europaea TaxID=158383 RepID=A0A8S0R2E3_OLEEU|nr:Calreticulin [Olea europaea subsp. europaea]
MGECSIMFGPDICGYSTKKIHAILTYTGTNHLIKKEVPCETDQWTHVYTFVIQPDANYSILVDNVEKQSDSLYSDWDLLLPSTIKDPEAKKVYDDIAKEMPDPDAKKDWDDEEDGEWTPQLLPTPSTRVHWKPKANYKGKWKAPIIDNPDYKDDPDLCVFANLKYEGIGLWQAERAAFDEEAERAAFEKREEEELHSIISDQPKDYPVDSDVEDGDGVDDADDADADVDIKSDTTDDESADGTLLPKKTNEQKSRKSSS